MLQKVEEPSVELYSLQSPSSSVIPGWSTHSPNIYSAAAVLQALCQAWGDQKLTMPDS